MKLFFVISVPEDGIEPICRSFYADDTEHCEEQFLEAIPDERISWIVEAPPPSAVASEPIPVPPSTETWLEFSDGTMLSVTDPGPDCLIRVSAWHSSGKCLSTTCLNRNPWPPSNP